MFRPVHHVIVVMSMVCTTLITTSCDTMGPHEQEMTALGCATGAIGGGLLGLVAGHGSGTGAAVGVGAGLLAGCAAGNIIGRQLDERDRQAAEAATLAALNAPPTRRPVAHTWHSDHGTGNRGSVVVQSTTRPAGGGECKQVNEVAYIQGQEVNQPMKYCRSGPDGEWAQAQA
jgi:surface antigen